MEQEKIDYIYSQLIGVYSEKETQIIIDMFISLLEHDSILSMDIIEVIEEIAELNHNTQKIPYWLYDVIPYNDFCDYLESLEVIDLGEDFIKLDDNLYYQITDVVNMILVD